MASQVSPAVITEEINFLAQVARISGAILGVAGAATRGAPNVVTLLNSVDQLTRLFGFASPSEAKDGDNIPIGGTQAVYQADHFLRNGNALYFVRTAGSNLAFASLTLDDNGTYYGGGTPVLTFQASTEGTWANDQVGIEIENVNATTYNVYVSLLGNRQEQFLSVTQSTIANRINGISNLVTVTVLDSSTIPGDTLDPISAKLIAVLMSGGDDGLFAKSQGTASSPHIVDASTAATIRIRSIREGDVGNREAVLTDGLFIKVDDSVGTPLTPLRLRVFFKAGVIPGEEFLAADKAELITRVNAGSNFIRLEDVITNVNEPDIGSPQDIGLEGGLSVSDVIGTQVGNVITGLKNFRNADLININIVAAPGQYHRQVLSELEEIAEERNDTIALFATPFDLAVDEIIDWTNGVLSPEAEIPFPPLQALNSSFTALIYQWIRTFDSVSDTSVWTSSEGTHASIMAFTDAVSEPWFSPAGLIRGAPSWIEDITFSPRLSERESLLATSPTKNVVNPWVNEAGIGISLQGDFTCIRQAGPLDNIGVRRGLNAIKKVIATSTKFLLFEPNDPTLFRQWRMLVKPFMSSVQARRGVREFQIRMDETTTTPQDLDAGRAIGIILLKPVTSTRQIIIQFVLTPAGASFDEILNL